MATESRHRARTAERNEPPDPAQTGAHARLGAAREADARTGHPSDDESSIVRETAHFEARAELDRLSERPSGTPARRSRVTRPSMRPSAFGMPRVSQPVSASVSSAGAKRESSPPPSGARPSEATARTTAKRAAARTQAEPSKKRPPVYVPPPVKTDIEELLPITQGVKSLPRPPRVPTFEQATHLPAPRRFPWASLSVFGVMLAASFVPLLHYRGERQDAPSSLAAEPAQGRLTTRPASSERNEPGATSPRTVGQPGVGGIEVQVEPASLTRLAAGAPAPSTTLPAVQRIERAFAGQPSRLHLALIEEGDRVLRAGDERLAELLFARALDFSDDARGAFGLARVRLAQGDLDGAEGWIVIAIRQHPQRQEYRALHAELLQRRGRASSAPTRH
jgi:hypothetical protein